MPESSRRHNRTHFYKYMPADTALKVLASARLRWSSPVRFNDPFDVPREIAHGFNSHDISRAIGHLINKYLDNPPADLKDFDESLAALLTLAKGGFPVELREQIRNVIAETVQELASKDTGLKKLRDHWEALVPRLRILCLAESPSHVAMWHHYADCYRGVVLGLRCNDDNDNFLLVAEPIHYLNEKPDVYTDSGLAKLLCLNAMAAAGETMRLATYTKSDDWSYENEWRIVTNTDDGDPQNYSDWSFEPGDLSHIYLGPLISEEDSQQLIQFIKLYPNAEVFRTRIGFDRELHFERHEG